MTNESTSYTWFSTTHGYHIDPLTIQDRIDVKPGCLTPFYSRRYETIT